MTAIFLKIINMGITASWLMLAIYILRFLLRRLPKWITCVLWALAAVRLICPFSVKSTLSLIPDSPTLFEAALADSSVPADGQPDWKAVDSSSNRHFGTAKFDKADTDNEGVYNENANNEYANSVNANNKSTNNKSFEKGKLINRTAASFLCMIWISGTALMLFYSLASYLKLCRHTHTAIPYMPCMPLMPLYKHVMICDRIDVPFVLGIIRPRIYLPSDLDSSQAEYVIAHEEAHITRLDHWWKLAGFLILSVYWFHPLCWISYILFCRDIETACDERVIKSFDLDNKKKYAEALLTYSINQKTITACPLAFGEIGAEKRIKNILHYKKPAVWGVLASLAVCAAAAACFLTDPAEKYLADDGTKTDAAMERNNKQHIEQYMKQAAEKKDPLHNMLQAWTQAFVDRDGETIASLASAEAAADLKDRELLMGQKGSFSFGVSSPWPQDYDMDCLIEDYGSSPAEIYYYARTSEPHITIWKETLKYKQDGAEYRVTGEKLACYDSIASGKEYNEAYSFPLDGSMMDYTQNDLGQSLNSQALLSKNSKVYRSLFSPETAAVQLLNLSPKDTEITRTGDNTPRTVGLDITFPKDHVTITISMIRPFGESGIWVPADYKIDVVTRFMDVNWNDVEKLPYIKDGSSDPKKILCIGELPEHNIKIYGYNDEEISGRGTAIEIDGNVNYFDWAYTSPQGIMPDLYWDDTHRQLQIAFHIYTGTGAGADSLYVLQYHDTGTLQPYRFDLDDYRAELQSRIGYTFDEKTRKLTLTDLETEQELASAVLSEGDVTGMEFGLISGFQLGDTITLQVTPGYYVNDSAIAHYENMPVLEFDVAINPKDYDSISFNLEHAREKR